MSERECTCGLYGHTVEFGEVVEVAKEMADDCSIHGTEKGEIPPLNRDKGALNIPQSKGALPDSGVLHDVGNNSMGNHTEVVERLGERARVFESLVDNQRLNRLGPAACSFTAKAFRDALTAIHDLQAEVVRLNEQWDEMAGWCREAREDRDDWKGAMEGAAEQAEAVCEQLRETEAENERLVKDGQLALDLFYDSAHQAIRHVGSLNSNEREREAEGWIHTAWEEGKEALAAKSPGGDENHPEQHKPETPLPDSDANRPQGG